VSQNARPVLVVVVARVVRSVVVLQDRDRVDFAGFAGGIGCFRIIVILAALLPAMRRRRFAKSNLTAP
jgi:hypothetical protein